MEIEKGHRWSFSALTSFEQCPYMWKLHYIDGLHGEDNYFSEFGTAAHKVIEMWANGELSVLSMPDEWAIQYKTTVKHDPPPFPVGMADKNYLLAERYFDSFAGLPGQGTRILGAEKKCVLPFDDDYLIGVMDLVIEKADGSIEIIDHKTSSPASMDKAFKTHYIKQLYIYAMFCKECFGKYPTAMSINMIKAPDRVYCEQFDPDKLEEIKGWIRSTIAQIRANEDWTQKKDLYFCQNLCGMRNVCGTEDWLNGE